jgi:hypothetical protein
MQAPAPGADYLGVGAPPPAAAPVAAAPGVPVTAPLTDNEAGLRALLLRQKADGLFGDLAATLAAIAALTSRGHTAREGLFRGELRRALATLRARLATETGDARLYAALGIALLTLQAPPELPPEIAAHLASATVADVPALRRAVRSSLAAVPDGWRGSSVGAEIARVFGL